MRKYHLLHKTTALYLLKQIKGGFFSKNDAQSFYNKVVKLFTYDFISAKDCKILTSIIERYLWDNFEIYDETC